MVFCGPVFWVDAEQFERFLVVPVLASGLDVSSLEGRHCFLFKFACYGILTNVADPELCGVFPSFWIWITFDRQSSVYPGN